MEPSLALEGASVEELNKKIDRLTAQVEFLAEEALRQKRRQQEWDELLADLVPISKEAFNLVSEQLEEVEECARLENVLNLAKRLLRNTCALGQMLEQMESLMDFWQDFSPLTRSVVTTLMNRLDGMERKGYFVFVQAMLDSFDGVVASFSREELEQLRENIVPLVETAKEAVRPEVMQVLHRMVLALQQDQPAEASLFGLTRQMNDPQVRRGLGRMVQLLKAVGQ
jgi:uncharacterized protein YjgD (DUF1641 family)/tetrahydromethanopterin S-methyltransferase subunit G